MRLRCPTVSAWSGGCLDRLDASCFGFRRRRSTERDEAPQRRVVSNWEARWTHGGFGNVSRIGPRGPGRAGAAPSRPYGRRVLRARFCRDARPRWRCGRLAVPALRELSDAGAWRRAPDGASLVCQPRSISSHHSTSLCKPAADLLLRAARSKTRLAAGIDQSPSDTLALGTQPRATALAALHQAAAGCNRIGSDRDAARGRPAARRRVRNGPRRAAAENEPLDRAASHGRRRL